MKYLLALMIPLLCAVTVEADEWQERLDKEGIQVLSRPAPGSKYKEFRGTIEFEGETAHAVALLQDNSACTRWLYRCVRSHVIEQVSNTERYFYQSTSLPFPARARDAAFHAEVFYNPDKSINIQLKSTPTLAPETEAVRIQEAYGHYLLEPLDGGVIRLTWQQFIDPAGVLPAWLVNTLLTDIPFKSLKAFRQLVAKPPYAQATFIYDDNDIPIDIVVPGKDS